ncbi:integrase [Streptomyces sp. NPDC003442]
MSYHRGHPAQTRALHAHLRRRNAHARHPDLLAAQRKEHPRIRGEKVIRWGERPLNAIA